MANTNMAGGFTPFQNEPMHVGIYAVPTANTIGFYHGDLVQGNNSFTSTSLFGALPTVKMDVVITTTDGATHPIYGAITGIFSSTMDPLLYLPPATTGDGVVSGYLTIADNPMQIFMAQGDGIFTAADMDLNYEVTPGTLNAGSTTTGLSTMMIKAASGNTVAATIPIRLIAQAYPQTESIASAYAKMICQINGACHYRGQFTAI